MPFSKSSSLAPSLVLAFATHLSAWGQGGGVPTYNRDVRPILSDHCFSCHGMDAKHRKADLRLDVAEAAMTPNKEGKAAIVPGNLASSELWKRLNSTDAEEIMPPPDSHKELSASQKDTLKRWIEAGAKYEKHWAFEKPVKPQKDGTGAVAMDFLLDKEAARLGLNTLAAKTEADRPTLIRRVAFALTGLPPQLAEVDDFINDQQDGAYERMVDRFLAKPAYGEEMARHWLDVARYGDTHGLHLDNERQMWAYRDWVVDAFNNNLSFDQFTIQQLAGDLLPEATDSQLVATGFNRCNVTTSEGGAINDEWLFRYAVDRASTTAQTWLGLTAGCAVCHDHKYDPISQKEFYQLYAFFYSNADPAMDGNAKDTAPTLKVMSMEEKTANQALQPRKAAVRKALKDAVEAINYVDPATQQPPPPAQQLEEVWFDDSFPKGAELNGTPTYATKAKKEPVQSGERSLKQTGDGIMQVFYNTGAEPLTVPTDGVFSMQVFLPKDKPAREVMVQFNTGDWTHRAAWGQDTIPWGEAGKPSRMLMGPLTAVDQWVNLTVPFAHLGLKPGTKLKGFALTMESGTAYFDNVRVTASVNPAADPAFSYKVWRAEQKPKKAKELPEEIRASLKKPIGKEKPAETARMLEYYLGQVCQGTAVALGDKRKAWEDILKEEQKILENAPITFIYRDLAQPRQAHIMARGQYDKPTDPVEPGVPAVFPSLQLPAEKKRADRLDLAKWLVSAENPLTARVTVNRLWQQFFGIGLVKSSHDFGVMGNLPSHDGLLDYLAIHFQTTGWDVKHLVREMLTTKAFKQSSVTTASQLEKDPENIYLLHGPRFRLDGEQLRDNVLATSGLLVDKIGGKGVNPYQPPNIWEPVGFGGSNTRNFKQDNGEKLYRRSLYTFFKRTAPHPMFTNFDAPNREQFCTRRERSNTPLQALQLMNDVQHYEAARALAQRVMKEGGASPEAQLNFLYRTVLARNTEPAELELVKNFFTSELAKYQANPAEAKKAVNNGESKPDASLPEPVLAAWTLVCNLVLNLDETVTRN